MTHNLLTLSPNVPVEIALLYAVGKPVEGRDGPRQMYTLVDGRVMFLDAPGREQRSAYPAYELRFYDEEVAALL
jgi:hypothetical protein